MTRLCPRCARIDVDGSCRCADPVALGIPADPVEGVVIRPRSIESGQAGPLFVWARGSWHGVAPVSDYRIDPARLAATYPRCRFEVVADPRRRCTPPARVQLRRTKGWRLPPATVVVARPSKWGNPYKMGQPIGSTSIAPLSVAESVEWFEHALVAGDLPVGLEDLAELVGHDLACWCHLDAPCHADVLLRLTAEHWGIGR